VQIPLLVGVKYSHRENDIFSWVGGWQYFPV